MTTSRLAKAIVQMAESRAEVLRKEIETEFVDYFIELLSGEQEPWYLCGDSIFVLIADGIMAKSKGEIMTELASAGKGGKGKGRVFCSRAHVLNAMAGYGYDSSTATFASSKSIIMRLRVPRQLLEAHPKAAGGA